MTEEKQELMNLLKIRFEANKSYHQNISWESVQSRLDSHPEKIKILKEMEKTGGEPDVIWYDANSWEYIFFDCSSESPLWRRSFCYDKKALDSRKENKPKNSVENMAREIGIELLDETEYRYLQTLGNFDLKTSSWIATPESIRKLGGALFCDRRYDTIFCYHNGADSYYAARGFRGKVRI